MRSKLFLALSVCVLSLTSCGDHHSGFGSNAENVPSTDPGIDTTGDHSADHSVADAHENADADTHGGDLAKNSSHTDHRTTTNHNTTDRHAEHGNDQVAKTGHGDHVKHTGDHAAKSTDAHSGHQGKAGDPKHGAKHKDTTEVALAEASTKEASQTSADELFSRRILPILKAKNPSSCTECHFAGVELSNYVHEDQAKTFVSLRNGGLIDVENPDKSKILQFISRKPKKENALLSKVRQREYQAFRAWIRAAVKDPELLAAKKGGGPVGSELPVEVIRHMRRDRVLASFVDNVWSEIGRCINCHSPERNQRLVKKHGEQVSWIRPRDPEGTLQQAVDQGIIDFEEPEESLMLTKPLVLVEHGGGPKFVIGSRTDKNFRRFLNDYAAVINKKYTEKSQLPPPSKDVIANTGQQLRIVELPKRFGKKLLRVNIYRYENGGWSKTPWATADNPVNEEKNLWQSMVFAVAPRGSKRAERITKSERAARLPAGRYLIKVYVDQEGKTKKNRNYELGDKEFIGQVETKGEWKPGYQPPKIVNAPR